MLEQIVNYVRQCPDVVGVVDKDFVSHTDGAVGVQLLACEPILQRYMDGGSLRQAMFRLLFREAGQRNGQNRGELYHRIEAWVEGGFVLPELTEGQTAQRVEIVKTASLTGREFGGNCYSMDCRLIYYQKGV